MTSLIVGVPAELLATQGSATHVVLWERLAQRLQDDLALTDEAALWAVRTWASALGIARIAPPAPARSGHSVKQAIPQNPAVAPAAQGSARAAEALYRIADDPENELSVRLDTAEKLSLLDPGRAAGIFYAIATDDDNDLDDRIYATDRLAVLDSNRAAQVDDLF